MAFRVMRNKRNQRWTQRLHEIFQEWDKSQNGYISLDCMIEIYRIYKVTPIQLFLSNLNKDFHLLGGSES